LAQIMLEPSVCTSRGAMARLRPRRSVLAVLACALAVSCASSGKSGEGPAWSGDPAIVAQAAPLLAANARALADVRTLEASCQRTERAANGAARSVDDGRLVARRDPPCVVLNVNNPKPRSIREDGTSRLVIVPLERGATRWTFSSNFRGLISVAALFLDLDVLARSFEIADVLPEPAEGEGAQRIVLETRNGASDLIVRLELVLAPNQAVPSVIYATGAGGDQLVYRIRRPTLEPKWRDPAARFSAAVPAGYALQEIKEP
jgi:hypothetical protein